MRAFVIAAALSATFTINTGIHAQPGVFAGPDRVAGRGPGRGPQPIVQPAPGGLRTVSSYQGKVVKLQYNADYVFDGFYVVSGGDSVLVTFPAHLGRQISGVAKVGSNVNFAGTAEMSPFGGTEVRLVSLNNEIINDSPRLEAPVEEKFVEGKGKISSFRRGRDGMVDGVFVDNQTLLKLPPHLLMQLGNTLQPGSGIAYSGNKKNANSGEVMERNLSIVHVHTFTINGQQYLVR